MSGAKFWLNGGVILAVVIAGYAFLSQTIFDDGPTRLQPLDAEMVALGQAVYADHCAACHGNNLEGEPNWRQRDADGTLPAPPHDETGHTWHHADALLFDVTKRGIAAIAGGDYKTNMPVYDGVLSDAEIVAVLSFIKSTWSPQVQARQSALNPE